LNQPCPCRLPATGVINPDAATAAHIAGLAAAVFGAGFTGNPGSHQGALKRCEQLCSQLQVPVINHPSNIRKTARDKIPVLLKGIPGLRVPETISLTPRSPGDIFTEVDRAGLVFPVIVILAGKHGGKSSILITGRDDIDKLTTVPLTAIKKA
jgi:hypothetical protein